MHETTAIKKKMIFKRSLFDIVNDSFIYIYIVDRAANTRKKNRNLTKNIVMLIRGLLRDSELYFYRLIREGERREREDPKFFVNFFLFVFEKRITLLFISFSMKKKFFFEKFIILVSKFPSCLQSQLSLISLNFKIIKIREKWRINFFHYFPFSYIFFFLFILKTERD